MSLHEFFVCFSVSMTCFLTGALIVTAPTALWYMWRNTGPRPTYPPPYSGPVYRALRAREGYVWALYGQQNPPKTKEQL